MPPKDVCEFTTKRFAELHEARMQTLSARCDSGGNEACEELLKPDNFVEGSDLAERFHRVIEHHRAACVAGDGKACATAVSYLEEKRPKKIAADEPLAMDMRKRACDSGLGEACWHLAGRLERMVKARGSAPSPQGKAKIEALRRKAVAIHRANCASGDPSACSALAQVLIDDTSAAVDERNVYEALARGCDLGLIGACQDVVLRYWEPDEPPLDKFTAEERKRMFARIDGFILKVCETGDHEYCWKLDSQSSHGMESDEFVALVKMLCQKYDYPGINCSTDIEYFDRFCRGFCADRMYLPE